ncbi:MAG: DUF362 domain-containing protein [Candidatus Latescibacteria bacterium]|jgi:uncharacterized protein (DUF362 family)|nr:DUF362 domain-containing protein [Candidatus Latescibacterota bacterium]
MRIDADRVYVYRVSIDSNCAPKERYRELAYDALSRLDLGVPEEGRILLKPNLTVLWEADRRVITHPGFVSGILDVLLERGAAGDRITVGDGASGERPDRGAGWEISGYKEAMDPFGVTAKTLTGEEARWLEVPGGVVYEKYPVYREVTDCALFINLPLAKCHNLVCTTLAIKNLMGTLDRPERHLCTVQEVDKPYETELWRLTDSGLSLHEERFCHKLADLVSVHRTLPMPRLNVIDGLIGRDGTAFNEGDNHPLGWTVIGVNEVHVDTVGSYLMGLDSTAMPYLKVASERGLGTNRLEEIEIVDLATGEVLDTEGLEAHRSGRVLMPICRYSDGYYDRLRADGSVVPWRIDAVNKQREEDGLEPVPVT